MRLRILVVVCLFAFAVVAMAADQPQKSTTPQPWFERSPSGLIVPTRPWAMNPPVRFTHAPIPWQASLGCFKLRTYIFQREDGGDAMRQVAERTCTPAWRFQVKSAIGKPR